MYNGERETTFKLLWFINKLYLMDFGKRSWLWLDVCLFEVGNLLTVHKDTFEGRLRRHLNGFFHESIPVQQFFTMESVERMSYLFSQNKFNFFAPHFVYDKDMIHIEIKDKRVNLINNKVNHVLIEYNSYCLCCKFDKQAFFLLLFAFLNT